MGEVTKDRHIQRLLNTLPFLIDERVGIIRHVDETPRDPGSPDLFHFFAQACDTQALSGQTNFSKTGGVSFERSSALAKAVGEAIERYCGAQYDFADLPLHTYADAPFPCVHPSEFALLSPAQYNLPTATLAPFDEHTPARWALTFDPLTGQVWHVPAAMVYVPYIYHRGKGESPIAQSISTGLACHGGFAEAALSAVCEVIERDAFTITWQAMLGHPQIRVESLSERNRDITARIEKAGYPVTLFDMTMDTGVPSILAVSRSANFDAPPLVPAGSTSPAPEEAVRKSLEELEHTRTYCHKIKMYAPRLATDSSYANVTDQTSHLNFWCDPANTSLADFFFRHSNEGISRK